MKWNYGVPTTIGNYIVDAGPYGIRLSWYDGSAVWKVMWGDDEIKVYGWIEVPKH